MSEPLAPTELAPVDRERIVLAQAEIKSLLLPVFSHTPLEDLFSELPISFVNQKYTGVRRDYIGTRNISGTGLYAVNERELGVYLRSRKRFPGRDIGEQIRLVEAGRGSARDPKIEHFKVTFDGGIRPFSTELDPVDTALDLAHQIADRRS